jgi:hypothetical protein
MQVDLTKPGELALALIDAIVLDLAARAMENARDKIPG